MQFEYPKTRKIKKIDNYHGTNVSDPYQWLEKYSKKVVKEWIGKQERLTRSYIDKLPQKAIIQKRLNELLRYDEKTLPWEILKGKRIFFYERKKDDEKWVYYTQEDENSEKVELIDPNKWADGESLSFVVPSVDGKYLVFGKDKGGDENPIIYIMEVKTMELLSDSVSGWKQNRVSWLHDNSGFYYSRKPLKGEVKNGEEYYWDEVYFHGLGTSFLKDKKIFFCKDRKEYYHTAEVSEDGDYVIFYRSTVGKTEVYFKKIDSKKMIPIAEGFDADYRVNIINDKIIIKTNLGASNGKVFIADVNNPEKSNWKNLIGESEDKLYNVSAIAGNLYLEYIHRAYSKIKIYSLEGNYIKDLKLPDMGSANVCGYFTKSNIWVMFSSFIFPFATYKYDFRKNKLKLFFKPSIDLNIEKFSTNQIEYKSKDGTMVTMFLLSNRNLKKNGKNPILLTGYGGFGISIMPYFSTNYVVWLEAGGMVAIPNLRGGGEYGKEWHEAGKLDKKQNVFDDFIASAEWLINEKYTSPKKIAISGGSNGGLLVGAVTIQRPELFRVVNCAVPLLDMLRYHKLSIANTWVGEYGSSEDPEQFKYIYKYSPYHNIKKNVEYPAILITTSENDARVDPMHALKMVAKLQEVNPNGEPILLLVRKSSGHCGGTTISKNIEQTSEEFAFLMKKLGMN
ncbi:MAG: prolyl oligopeptidase family serine peptidase [Candidatus Aenigmatarchaeota archaeon]